MGNKALELYGLTFSYLTVISRVRSNRGGTYWKCKCICGNTTIVRGSSLVRAKGGTKSCGCRKGVIEIHGMSYTTEYGAWHSMIQRCINPNMENFTDYGGRGIKVCDRWRNSFLAFFEDMGPKPKGYTLDRINTDGDYEPTNCRWADWETQQNNRRNNTLITMPNGEIVTLKQASDIMGIGYDCLQRRNWRHKGDTEKLFAPYKALKRKIKII